ncbi:histidine phosphatase family protein [Pseudomonas cichorii]|uniref:lipopolysaccharide core heptose(II)-phosphate phosphatase PmrG n=1 Tax=Pseudomonas cichorii TaxID=36746 RepID=UPI001C89710A|nr:histidine phosphatase family protein [Pseudomonas cichorii]MBX8484690.1 histidine phosphatase family protein [Pseudomonas cichorii]
MAFTRLYSAVSEKQLLHKQHTHKSGIKNVALFLALSALLAVFVWLWTATRIVDLSVGDNISRSGLYGQWAKGDVVVMIRHAERCDRSHNACMGDADGITIIGSQAAMKVGAGLQQLGLEKASIITSPLTRTRQTADLISGGTALTQRWVEDCDSGFKEAVLAHKKPNENLVLITHSGCIDHFERKMGVRGGQRSSAYTQAFFVKVDGRHAPKLLGALDAEYWDGVSNVQLN